jgi:hypothetical protein
MTLRLHPLLLTSLGSIGMQVMEFMLVVILYGHSAWPSRHLVKYAAILNKMVHGVKCPHSIVAHRDIGVQKISTPYTFIHRSISSI